MRKMLGAIICAGVVAALPSLGDPPTSPAVTKVPLPAAFSFSAQDANNAVAEGQKLASQHKSQEDVLKPFASHPKWTRGLGQGNTDPSLVIFES